MKHPKRAVIVIGVAAVAAAIVATVLATSDRSAQSIAISSTNNRELQSTVAPTATVAEGSAEVDDVPAAIAADYAEWTVVFDDQFDDSDLSPQWTTCFWWQVDGGCTIGSNEELQWYRPEAVRVTEGVLRLEATADPQVTSDDITLPYRSGMASTGPVDDEGSTPGLSFTYGYVEAVVQFPTGGGTWPAVWLLSADLTSTPEIDIVEHYGSEAVIKSRVHQRVDGVKISEGFETPFSPTADGWHRVGVLWTQHEVRFYFDDVLTGVIDDDRLVPTTPMYLIVNLAMGGRAGPVDEQTLPQHFDIDRIRVWQKEST